MLKHYFFILIIGSVPFISNGMEGLGDSAGAPASGSSVVTPSYVWTEHKYRFGELGVVLDHNPVQRKLTINVKGPEGELKQEADFFKLLEPVRDLLRLPGLTEVSAVFHNVKALIQGDFNAYFEGANLNIIGSDLCCPGPLLWPGSLQTINTLPMNPLPTISLIDTSQTINTLPMNPLPTISLIDTSGLIDTLGLIVTGHLWTPEDLRKEEREVLVKLGAYEEMLVDYDASPNTFDVVCKVGDIESARAADMPTARDQVLVALGKTMDDFYRAKGYSESRIEEIRAERETKLAKKVSAFRELGATDELLEGKDLSKVAVELEILSALGKAPSDFYGILSRDA